MILYICSVFLNKHSNTEQHIWYLLFKNKQANKQKTKRNSFLNTQFCVSIAQKTERSTILELKCEKLNHIYFTSFVIDNSNVSLHVYVKAATNGCYIQLLTWSAWCFLKCLKLFPQLYFSEFTFHQKKPPHYHSSITTGIPPSHCPEGVMDYSSALYPETLTQNSYMFSHQDLWLAWRGSALCQTPL